MKRLPAVVIALLGCSWLTAMGQNHDRTVTLSDAASDDCNERLHMYNGDYRAYVRDEETRRLPNQPLVVKAEHNGGIQVTTWDQPEFSVKLCKQVAAGDETEGRRILNQVKLAVNGPNVTIESPDLEGDGPSLGTLLVIKAPRNATLDLTVHNGGVSLVDFVGTAKAHAQNGGIALKKSSGVLTAEAQNGGVSIVDCGGEVNARVQNGGISINLPEHWEGKGLTARSMNGGLSISLPRTFNGGVEVVGSQHSSFVCKDSSVCDSAEKTWDNEHRIMRWGGTNPQIHVTTVNGGVVVKERGPASGKL
jgi:DUF4097 and DUF4098 domain-containing protein YvlB